MTLGECLICKAPFVGSKNKKYCSPACKQKAVRGTVSTPFGDKSFRSVYAEVISVIDSFDLSVKAGLLVESDFEDLILRHLLSIGLIHCGGKDIDTFTYLINAIPLKRGDTPCCLYVIGSECGAVKVGVSSKPNERINTISHASGRIISCSTVINLTSRKEAINAESNVKRKFKNKLIKGEWFNVGFDEMSDFAKSITATNNNQTNS